MADAKYKVGDTFVRTNARGSFIKKIVKVDVTGEVAKYMLSSKVGYAGAMWVSEAELDEKFRIIEACQPDDSMAANDIAKINRMVRDGSIMRVSIARHGMPI